MCSFCFAENYTITQTMGTSESEYVISIGNPAKIDSDRDGEKKTIELSFENKKFIEKRLKKIERMHGHEIRFCPRNYIQLVNQKKAKSIIACGNSTTEIATSLRQLIRVINVYSVN
tara:strand:- start:88 stop:435 length:348 start_codon:yes stop_codon:yes gene_type:complete